MSDIQVSVEETGEPVDGTAKCSFGSEGVVKVTIEGKEDVVCRAIKALFTELADVLFADMTPEEASDLLAKFNAATGDLKGGTVYHARMDINS